MSDKRVVSESELRPGLWVKLRKCQRCGGRTHKVLLLTLEPQGDGRNYWQTFGMCSDQHLCYLYPAIAQNRVLVWDTKLKNEQLVQEYFEGKNEEANSK